jgi:hypothetical protein
MIATRDVGLIPEPLFYDLIGPDREFKTLYEYGQSDRYEVERILKAAKLAARGAPGNIEDYLEMTKDGDPVIRHWGAYGLFLVRPQNKAVQAALEGMIAEDPMAGNRIIAAQALGLCGDPDRAFEVIKEEALAAQDGYVLLFALNAFQYSHTDDRLTKDDWQAFGQVKGDPGRCSDRSGIGYANRIVKDALELWPERRTVD